MTNSNTPETLPVIFRTGKSADTREEVTAVFPTLPWDENGRELTVYAHVGQHGGASFGWYQGTRAAKPEEYAALLTELRGIYGESLAPGDSVYTLRVAARMSRHHRAAFESEVQRVRRRDRAAAARQRGETVGLGAVRPLPASVRQIARGSLEYISTAG